MYVPPIPNDDDLNDNPPEPVPVNLMDHFNAVAGEGPAINVPPPPEPVVASSGYAQWIDAAPTTTLPNGTVLPLHAIHDQGTSVYIDTVFQFFMPHISLMVAGQLTQYELASFATYVPGLIYLIYGNPDPDVPYYTLNEHTIQQLLYILINIGAQSHYQSAVIFADEAALVALGAQVSAHFGAIFHGHTIYTANIQVYAAAFTLSYPMVCFFQQSYELSSLSQDNVLVHAVSDIIALPLDMSYLQDTQVEMGVEILQEAAAVCNTHHQIAYIDLGMNDQYNTVNAGSTPGPVVAPAPSPNVFYSPGPSPPSTASPSPFYTPSCHL